jgi:hypothetical protein
MSETKQARFEQLSNDLYWRVYDGQCFIRWTGYDDVYWWNNVATQDSWRRRTGSDGRVYTLDPNTDTVCVADNGRASDPEVQR